MRTTIITTAALALCFSAATAFAQDEAREKSPEKKIRKEETVVIRKHGTGSKTVIEIRDGNVFVDGEKVADITDGNAANVHKKIVIDRSNGGGDDAFSMPFFDRDENDQMPRRAMLGVMTSPNPKGNGAVIKEVTPHSPASKAGLQSGDRITKVDDAAIEDANALVDAIGHHQGGDKVAITFDRNGKTQSVNAELAEAEPKSMARVFRFGPGNMPGMPNPMMRDFPFSAGDEPTEPAPKMGITAEDRADGSGVMVLDVKPGSPADKAGLKERDVIQQMGDDKIASVDELQKNLREVKPNESVKIYYQRNGKNATADLVMPRPVKRRNL